MSAPVRVWSVVWVAAGDERVVSRHARRDVAEAAAGRRNRRLQARHPGRLLCGYGVRRLVGGAWLDPLDPRVASAAERRVYDVPFDQAVDVGSIQYRLHPIDIGYDCREIGQIIAVARADRMRASYPRGAERWVIDGPQPAVLRSLRGRGFRFRVEAA